jgi:glycosyltransferase involved in cell wall biosynthesis
MIASNPEERDRPMWSVMIPVYNGTKYLAQALDSVVTQGFDEREMQIEVVDDCSSQSNPEAVVKTSYAKRVAFYRQSQRVGMAANWNTCIQRAKGVFIHILHQDDFVSDGYYREIQILADNYPNVGLYSTRSFYVDSESIITGVTGRVPELEQPAKATGPFFYQTPIQCAGVTVRRSSYEALGGFRMDLGYVTDCEMWARVTGCHGGIVSTKVKANYRRSNETETERVSKTGEGVQDICRLNEIFARRYPLFSVERGRARASTMAWLQYRRFKSLGDDAAAAVNWNIWARLTPVHHRLGRQCATRAMPYIRKLVFGAEA